MLLMCSLLWMQPRHTSWGNIHFRLKVMLFRDSSTCHRLALYYQACISLYLQLLSILLNGYMILSLNLLFLNISTKLKNWNFKPKNQLKYDGVSGPNGTPYRKDLYIKSVWIQTRKYLINITWNIIGHFTFVKVRYF